MTSGIDKPQLVINLNTPDRFEETGVIGWIELFGSPNYSLVIRPGVVILDGAANLSPDKARVLAEAINAGARLAEDYHGYHSSQSDCDENFT